MSTEFLLTTLVIVATPGTGVLYTLAAGLARGARASVVAACGCTLGIVPHMIAAITGLAALLHASAVAFQTIKYAGVAYLLYMAWSTLRNGGGLTVDEDEAPRSAARVIGAGVLVNLLNPKLTIFFFAFLPQFVDPEQGAVALQIVVLGLVFVLIAVTSDSIWALAAGTASERLRGSRRFLSVQRYVSGSVFVGLGALTATAKRH